MRRVAVTGISGSGKTTTTRLLARRLGVPHVELDELNHGPNWTEVTNEELRDRVERALAQAPKGWVADATYVSKLGELLYERADTLVWLDLPLRICLARIWKRTWGRILRREELWHGSRETIRSAFFARESLFRGAVRAHRRNPQVIPERAARHPSLELVRIISPAEVERFLATDTTADRVRPESHRTPPRPPRA